MVIILTMQFLHSIDNLLSPEECEKYMNYFSDSERVAQINDTHRKYNRVQFIDKELAKILYEKVKNYIPKKIKKIFKLTKHNLIYKNK